MAFLPGNDKLGYVNLRE